MTFPKTLLRYSRLPKFLSRYRVVQTNGNIWFKNYSFRRETEYKKKKEEVGIKKQKEESYSYIMDYRIARDIAKYVCEHTSSGAYVLEANPGPGILSRALLESGIPRLRVFEKEENITPTLQDLISYYPKCLEIVSEDLMVLPTLEVKDLFKDTDKTGVFFQGIQKRSWQEAPPVSLVTVITNQRNVSFMRCMLAKISVMSSMFSYGRCQFFLIMSKKEYMYITAKPKKNFDKYRPCTVLYNSFFDISFIREIPAACLSSDHLSSKKRAKWKTANLYFCHLIPKANLFEEVAPADILPGFYSFVQSHMSKRTCYVIELLETLIPSCGSRLIYDGIKVTSRFGDLSPPEILQLFRLVSSWPEYEPCTFQRSAAEHFHTYFSGVTGTEDDETQQ